MLPPCPFLLVSPSPSPTPHASPVPLYFSCLFSHPDSSYFSLPSFTTISLQLFLFLFSVESHCEESGEVGEVRERNERDESIKTRSSSLQPSDLAVARRVLTTGFGDLVFSQDTRVDMA